MSDTPSTTDQTQAGAENKAKPSKAAAAVKVKAPEQDWGLPQRDENGFQLADDGLPLTGVARAMALAAAGKSTDASGIVSDEAIAAHDPKPAAADREAIDRFHADQTEQAAVAAQTEQEGN